ncbi:hypothetical protein [Polaribacter atrinae]|uniref:Uncharacterized protein n=1 Tax=Polaribacter atrinae TaxID=1333662 RepID=A0A176SZ14_9FLAO|nr:hypothetical protein [Polaribacter atrinae]OAD40671.1 hypothetical protein LPB303_16860 [Polaribacter atrinae]
MKIYTPNDGMNGYKGFKRKFDFFIQQYGEDVFNEIKMETLNSPNVINLYRSLENKYYPTAENIMNVTSEVNYIIKKTIIIIPSKKKYEKKIDYSHICSMIILEHWILNLLPYQEENPLTYNSGDIKKDGFIFMSGVMSIIENEYRELEKKYLD